VRNRKIWTQLGRTARPPSRRGSTCASAVWAAVDLDLSGHAEYVGMSDDF